MPNDVFVIITSRVVPVAGCPYPRGLGGNDTPYQGVSSLLEVYLLKYSYSGFFLVMCY